jgi:hypothetical protein
VGITQNERFLNCGTVLLGVRVVEIITTHFVLNTLFSKVVPFMRKRGKICTARQDALDNAMLRRKHKPCIPDN